MLAAHIVVIVVIAHLPVPASPHGIRNLTGSWGGTLVRRADDSIAILHVHAVRASDVVLGEVELQDSVRDYLFWYEHRPFLQRWTAGTVITPSPTNISWNQLASAHRTWLATLDLGDAEPKNVAGAWRSEDAWPPRRHADMFLKETVTVWRVDKLTLGLLIAMSVIFGSMLYWSIVLQRQWRRDRRMRRACCPECGYPVVADAQRCPECGHIVPESATPTRT